MDGQRWTTGTANSERVAEQAHTELYNLLEENLMKLVIAGMENQRLSNLVSQLREENAFLKNRPTTVTSIPDPRVQTLERDIAQLRDENLFKDGRIRQLEEHIRMNAASAILPGSRTSYLDPQRISAGSRRPEDLINENMELQRKLSQTEGEKAILLREREQSREIQTILVPSPQVQGPSSVEVAFLKAQLADIEKRNKESIERIAQLENILNSTSQENSTLKARIQTLSQDPRLSQQIPSQDQSQILKKITDENTKLSQRVQELTEKIAEQSMKVASDANLKNEIDGLKNSLKNSQIEHSSLSMQKQQLSQEVDKLKEINNLITRELESAKDKIQTIPLNLANSQEMAKSLETKNDEAAKLARDLKLSQEVTRSLEGKLQEANAALQIAAAKAAAQTPQEKTPNSAGSNSNPLQLDKLNATVSNYEKELNEMYKINKDLRERLVDSEHNGELLKLQLGEVTRDNERLKSIADAGVLRSATKQRIEVAGLGQGETTPPGGMNKFIEARDKVIEELKSKIYQLAQDRDHYQDQYTKSQYELSKQKSQDKRSQLTLAGSPQEALQYKKFHLIIEDLASKIADKESIIAMRENEISQLRRLTHQFSTDRRSLRDVDAELEGALSKIYDLERKLHLIPELDKKVNLLANENLALQEANKKLKLLVKEQDAKYGEQVSLVAQAQSIQSVLKTMEKEKAELEENNKNLMSKSQHMEKGLSEKVEVESTNARLKEENSRLQAVIMEVQGGIETLQSRLKEYEEEMRRLVKVESTKREIEKENAALKTQVADLVLKLEVLAKDCAKGREAKEQNVVLKDEVVRLEGIVKQLETAVGSLQVYLGEAEEKIKTYKAYEIHAEDLQSDIDKAKREKAEYEKKISTLEGCQELIPELNKRIAFLTAENKSLNDNIELLKSNISNLQNQLIEVESKIRTGKAYENKCKLLEEENIKLAQEYRNLKDKLADYDSLNSQYLTYESKYRTLAQENTALKTQINDLSVTVDELRAKLLTLETERQRIPTLENAVKSLEKEIRDKEESLRRVRKERDSVIEETGKLVDLDVSQNGDLTQKVAKLESELSRITIDLKTALGERDAMACEVEKLNHDLEGALVVCLEYKKQQENMNAMAAASLESNKAYQDIKLDRDRLEKEVISLRSKLAQATVDLSRIPDLERELSMKKEEIVKLCLAMRNLELITDAYKKKTGLSNLDDRTLSEIEMQDRIFETKMRELAGQLDKAQKEKNQLQVEIIKAMSVHERESEASLARTLIDRDLEAQRLRRRIEELEGMLARMPSPTASAGSSLMRAQPLIVSTVNQGLNVQPVPYATTSQTHVQASVQPNQMGSMMRIPSEGASGSSPQSPILGVVQLGPGGASPDQHSVQYNTPPRVLPQSQT